MSASRELCMVNISGCTQLTDHTLRVLDSCCRRLSSLNCSRCPVSDDGLGILLSSFLPLQHINLSGCSGVKGTCFVNKVLPTLRQVELSSMGMTNATADALAQSAPNLTHIILVNNLHLSDFGVSSIASSKFQLLIFLLLLLLLTILIYFSGCKSLRYLDLSCCPAVGDRALEAISHHSLKIETLMLTCCQQISDDGIQFLAEGCGDLHSLNLTNCPRLTDVSMPSLALLPSLHKVDLYRCGGVSPKAMRQLVVSKPSLRVDF